MESSLIIVLIIVNVVILTIMLQVFEVHNRRVCLT